MHRRPAVLFLGAVVLFSVAACGSQKATEPAPVTALETTSTTTVMDVPATEPESVTHTLETTSANAAVVVPATDPPPAGISPDSLCGRRARFGDPAESQYLLPYPVGETYRIHQSYCFSRGGHSDQLAYDFLLPIGADVLAARSGEVVALYEDAPDDGATENNYVFIQHDDGTVALYAHLRRNGIDVEVGDHVAAGERIGASGNSGLGLSDAPHLHFGVYRSWPVEDGDDVAVNFRNAQGPLDLLGGLLQGSSYQAMESTVAGHPITPPGAYPDADLTGIDLTGARLWGFEFPGADLSGALLTGADLSWAKMTQAHLVGADLSQANLTGANLIGADLTGTLLVSADLTGANLMGADLVGADLSGAYMLATDVRGADLTGAVLTRTLLIGTSFDDDTRWPEGYVPPPQP